MSSEHSNGAALAAVLKVKPAGFFARRKAWLGALLGLVLIAGGLRVLGRGKRPTELRFKTEPAIIGKLVVKVSATGNIQPTNKVEVSSELSGIVTQVTVDDNDRVKKGQLLAQLDLSKLKDAVAKSRASLVAAEAQVLQTQATVAEARAALARYRQVAKLSGGKVPSRAEMDGADANLKRAMANEANARASVAQARANLQSDETNVRKASIRSPIDGVVLTRKVEPGQTVAATLQAPVLFTLAEDLTKMELQVDVDEADVGQVKVGQNATFGVDAYPGRKYAGTITRVGYGSQVKDNVVTYPTLLKVNNDDLSLRPGMTATAEIVTITRESVLLVPSAALRFTPPAAHPMPGGGDRTGGSSGGLVGKLLPRPPSQAPKAKTPAPGDMPRVWLLQNARAVPIEVRLGASNGQLTEIIGETLHAGDQVITESAQP